MKLLPVGGSGHEGRSHGSTEQQPSKLGLILLWQVNQDLPVGQLCEGSGAPARATKLDPDVGSARERLIKLNRDTKVIVENIILEFC